MRIVILGGGFAGLAVAQRLERLLRPGEADVAIISRDNYALFTPMLPEVSNGDLEARHIVSPLRGLLRTTTLVLGEVVAIDFNARMVETQLSLTNERQQIGYDHLVLATGSVSATFGIPGVAEHSYPFKRLEDAESLRNHIIETLELADIERDSKRRKSLLTYVIVGGGYTGVEVAGELVDFFRSVLRFYRRVDFADVEVTLVEGGPKLLPDLLPRMGEYCASFLAGRGVRVRTSALVASVDAGGIALKDGTRLDSATVVWSAGVRPSPLIASLPLRHARNGGILVNGDMSVQDMPRVWALGVDPNAGRRILSGNRTACDSRRPGARGKHRANAAWGTNAPLSLESARNDGIARRSSRRRRLSKRVRADGIRCVVDVANVLSRTHSGVVSQGQGRARLVARVDFPARYRAASRRHRRRTR
jgi:NADH dehydrogenase